MATEGPFLHDGSQIAAGNYSSSQFLAVTQSTTADRTVVLAAAIGAQIYGVLQNKPTVGQAADVAFVGISKAVAGGTITRGDKLMTNASGQLITWTAGSAYAQVGLAQESAVVNQVFSAFLWGAQPKVLT